MMRMIADYMEQGFLENIIDMFKHDRTLYPIIGDLLADERGRVRLGAVALVEELKKEHEEEIIEVIPYIARNLKNPNPTIRGDTAYLLGIIGDRKALPHLKDALNEKNPMVKQVIEESIDFIEDESLNPFE